MTKLDLLEGINFHPGLSAKEECVLGPSTFDAWYRDTGDDTSSKTALRAAWEAGANAVFDKLVELGFLNDGDPPGITQPARKAVQDILNGD